jgi:putative nucleotidyltransferase with HDIG domain
MLHGELGRVESVLLALEKKRPEVAAHSRRVSAYAVRLASQYGFDTSTIETIRMGALLHDVGKLLVSSRILNKPGRPNAREWQELKIHPELGVEIAHRCGFDDDVCKIVLSHHERYDGSGYPDGAGKDDLHVTVRIVSLMDTFDALTSTRDYRERLTFEAARGMVARGAGAQFCPWVVSAFLAMPKEMFNLGPIEQAERPPHAEGQVFLLPQQMGQAWQAAPALSMSLS